MPLSPSNRRSPFDIPKPQKSSELLILDLEIHLASCQSQLEARKRLLSASIRVHGRYDVRVESEPSGRELKETNEERLHRLVKKRECLNWIVKHIDTIERLQRRILKIERKLKAYRERKNRGMWRRLLG